MVLYIISSISIKETAIVAWASSTCVHLLTMLRALWGAMFDYCAFHVDRENEETSAITFSKIEKWKDNEKIKCFTYSKYDGCTEDGKKGIDE